VIDPLGFLVSGVRVLLRKLTGWPRERGPRMTPRDLGGFSNEDIDRLPTRPRRRS
jgi:hypothetical protein